MYFLLVFQMITANTAGWTQLGLYETEAQCKAVATAVHEVSKEMVLGYICAPSKTEGTKI